MRLAGEPGWAGELAGSESRRGVETEAGWDSGLDSSPSKGWEYLLREMIPGSRHEGQGQGSV